MRFSKKMLCPRLHHPQKRMTSPNAGPSKNRTGQPSVNKNLRVHGKIIASKNTPPEKQPPPSPEKQPQPPRRHRRTQGHPPLHPVFSNPFLLLSSLPDSLPPPPPPTPLPPPTPCPPSLLLPRLLLRLRLLRLLSLLLLRLRLSPPTPCPPPLSSSSPSDSLPDPPLSSSPPVEPIGTL